MIFFSTNKRKTFCMTELIPSGRILHTVYDHVCFVDLCHNIKSLHLVGVIPSRTITTLKIDMEPKNHPVAKGKSSERSTSTYFWLQNNFPECTPKKKFAIILVNLHFLGDPNHPWNLRSRHLGCPRRIPSWIGEVPRCRKNRWMGGQLEQITSHYPHGGFLRWWVPPTTIGFSY